MELAEVEVNEEEVERQFGREVISIRSKSDKVGRRRCDFMVKTLGMFEFCFVGGGDVQNGQGFNHSDMDRSGEKRR